MMTRVAGGLALMTALSGCLGVGGGGAAAIAAGTLPVTGTGTILGATLPSTVTTSTNTLTGNPQAESNDGAVSTVSVYNIFNNATGALDRQIVLSDVTTVRYRGRTDNAGEAFYGVGYIGNATATLPTGQTISYVGFWENGQAVYDNGGGARQFYLRVDDTVSLSADPTANRITGSANARMDRDTNLGANTFTMNTDVERLVLDGTINGDSFAGTALLVDSGGNTVGTQSGEMVGGFFGANATEVAAAIRNTGTMTLEGAQASYVPQGVIGGTSR